MFITEDDYKVVIGDTAMKVVSQASAENRANAEREAQEEISGYLRPKYDCDAVFAAEGEGRNHQIVMFIRKERYERAIKWLEGVQSGKIVPDLPLMLNDDGEMVGSSIVYGCQRKLRHNW